jgi:hypothetical protein
MRRLVLAAFGVAIAASSTQAVAGQKTLSVFGGFVTNNNFVEVLGVTPIDYGDTGVFGVAPGMIWDLPNPSFKLSAEFQIVKYAGYQDNWEFNIVPIMIRWFPKEGDNPGLKSLGFGLGVSWASHPPENEIRRNDEPTSQEKYYWTIEAAFDTKRPDQDFFVRLHHRSTGRHTIGYGGSTDAVVLGVRQYF